MTVTIKDVARAAGVSVASVSRAMNGHENVAPEMRALITDIAAKLRYVPHGGARSLITRRTNTVGALLPDLHGEFFSELIRGMDAAARARNLHLLISSSHGSASEAGEVLRAMRGRVDGLLVMSPHADAELLADNLPAALPTVLVNTRVAGGRYASLSIDNYAGSTAMMEHLIARGYRRIAFVAGPAQNFDADERLRGYRDARARLLPGTAPAILDGDFTEQSGYRAGIELALRAERPDAVFAANDMMAIGCLFALGERGLSVPGDIALVGFDDIPIARFVTPPLTTVRVRIADLGTRALETLALAIASADDAPPNKQELGCDLVIRQSCQSRTETHAARTS